MSQPSFETLALKVLEGLGYRAPQPLGQGEFFTGQHVLGAAGTTIALANDAAGQTAGRELGRDLLFDMGRVRGFLGPIGAPRDLDGNLDVLESNSWRPLEHPDVAGLRRAVVAGAPGTGRRSVLDHIEAVVAHRALEGGPMQLPVRITAGAVRVNRLIGHIAELLRREIGFDEPGLVVPLVRAGYLLLLIEGVEAWTDNGMLDPNQGDLGAFMRLVGAHGDFVLTCDERYVHNELSQEQDLLPVGLRFRDDDSLTLSRWTPSAAPELPKIQDWLEAEDPTGFFGFTQRLSLLDGVVLEAAEHPARVVPAERARMLAFRSLPEKWRLLPYAATTLELLVASGVVEADEGGALRFVSGLAFEACVADLLARRYLEEASRLKEVLAIPDIPVRALRRMLHLPGITGERQRLFRRHLHDLLRNGPPVGRGHESAMLNGLRLAALLDEQEQGSWPANVVLKGADLPRCCIRDAILDDWDLSDTDLIYAVFRGVTFRGVSFATAYLAGAAFFDCTFEGCTLDDANCTGAAFFRCTFDHTTTLDGSTFWAAWLKDVNVASPERWADVDLRNAGWTNRPQQVGELGSVGVERAVAELKAEDLRVYPTPRWRASWADQLLLSALGTDCRVAVDGFSGDRPDQLLAFEGRLGLEVVVRRGGRVDWLWWDGSDQPRVSHISDTARAIGTDERGLVALAESGGTVSIWRDGRSENRYAQEGRRISVVLPLPQHLVVGYESGEVAVWSRSGGMQRPEAVSIGHGRPVGLQRLSAGLVAVFWDDSTVELLRPGVGTGQAAVFSVSFARVGRVLTHAESGLMLLVGRWEDGTVGCAVYVLGRGQLVAYWVEDPVPDLDAHVANATEDQPTSHDSTDHTLEEFLEGVVAHRSPYGARALAELQASVTSPTYEVDRSETVQVRLHWPHGPLHAAYRLRETGRRVRLGVHARLTADHLGRPVVPAGVDVDEQSGDVLVTVPHIFRHPGDYDLALGVGLAGLRQRFDTVIRVRSTNPFLASGQALQKERFRFFGRQRLLSEVTRQLQTQNCGLLGARRIGKTSLLFRVIEDLTEALLARRGTPLVPAFVSLEPFRTRTFNIEEMLGYVLDDLYARHGDWLDPGLREPFSQLLETPGNENRVVDELNASLRKSFGPNARLLVVLDELGAVHGQSEAADTIRPISDRNVRFLGASLPKHFSQPLDGHESSGLWTYFANQLSIGPLRHEEAVDLITSPIAGRWEMTPAVVDRAIALGSRIPNDLQFLMHDALERAARRDSRVVTLDDVEQGFEKVVASYVRLDGVWEQVAQRTRDVLAKAARRGRRLDMSLSQLDGLDLRVLHEWGLVDVDERRLHVPSGYQEWLQRNQLLEKRG